MDVLVAFFQSFFIALGSVIVIAALFFLVSRRKPDVPVILGISVGIGLTQSVKTLWPALTTHEPFVVAVCVALCVGLALSWRRSA